MACRRNIASWSAPEVSVVEVKAVRGQRPLLVKGQKVRPELKEDVLALLARGVQPG